jgi:hypothetical protein
MDFIDILFLAIFVAAWIVLVTKVLPRLGVDT